MAGGILTWMTGGGIEGSRGGRASQSGVVCRFRMWVLPTDGKTITMTMTGIER